MDQGLGALPWLAWRDTAEIEGVGQEVAAGLGCADVGCLRGLPAQELLEHPRVMNIFQPFGFGNADLPELPAEAFPAGRIAEVPVLAGNTRDEHRGIVDVFRGPSPPRTTRACSRRRSATARPRSGGSTR